MTPIDPPADPAPAPGSFGADVALLDEHTDVVVLGSGDARVAVVPLYQGRVMTSTSSVKADSTARRCIGASWIRVCCSNQARARFASTRGWVAGFVVRRRRSEAISTSAA